MMDQRVGGAARMTALAEADKAVFNSIHGIRKERTDFQTDFQTVADFSSSARDASASRFCSASW